MFARYLSFFLLLATLAVPARAFIPPVGPAIKEIFDDRKSVPGVELHARHRINVRGSDQFEIEERILKAGSEYLFLWRFSSNPQWFAGSWETASGRAPNYTVGRDKRFATRSGLWVKYFLQNNGDDFLSQLLSEQFLRRDQLLQFKPDFTPEGDPQGWDLRANYLKHDDVFLSRLPQGVGIAMVGTDAPEARRAIYIDKALKGIFRLEWRDNQQTMRWDFDSFIKSPVGGFSPRRASFEWEGAEAIGSDILFVRPANPKQMADFRTQFRNALKAPPLTASFDNAIRFLLSYR